jgi:hypothetical protein
MAEPVIIEFVQAPVLDVLFPDAVYLDVIFLTAPIAESP